MTSIRVAHAGADYEVVVGDLVATLPWIEAIRRGQLLPLVSDARVFGLHGGLLAAVTLPEPILVAQGEVAKDWGTLSAIVDRLAASGIKRGTPIVALGGGSVGDVAALAASLFKRGCPIIHVPTTLLAQADSAVGGKTAIDAAGQKNLVGTFHHPLLVIADPALLATLDDRNLRSGYAEVVKYGLIDDPAFFDWCETSAGDLLEGDQTVRQSAVEHCIRAKARFVAADPDDTGGTRALLNFGHTFGHALEALAGHRLLHGEAVALGMMLAFDFSAELGICQPADALRVRAHLQSVGLPTQFEEVGFRHEPADLLQAMLADKKAGAEGLTLILAAGIGKAFVAKGVDARQLSSFLERRT